MRPVRNGRAAVRKSRRCEGIVALDAVHVGEVRFPPSVFGENTIIKQKKKGKEQPLKGKRLVVFRREHEKN